MKTKVLFYCTKGKPYLSSRYIDVGEVWSKKYAYNGKIVCECEVECEEIKFNGYFCPSDNEYTTKTLSGKELMKKSCLDLNTLVWYLKSVSDGNKDKNVAYALHISNLKVFDKPLRLIEVEHKKVIWGNEIGFALEKAPQNMMWVWYKGETYCLISIRPEWLCKILNGEKTIEVRKKILKGMM